MSDDNLDINTPRGREAAADQHRAAAIVFGRDERFSFLSTDDEDKAAADGVMSKNGIITGVAEIKARKETYDVFMDQFNSEWLLTYQKLLDIQTLSRLMVIPSYGLVYMKPSRRVVMVNLTNKHGVIICKHREAMTKTQATCNGGEAMRNNSYIDLRKGMIYEDKAVV